MVADGSPRRAEATADGGHIAAFKGSFIAAMDAVTVERAHTDSAPETRPAGAQVREDARTVAPALGGPSLLWLQRCAGNAAVGRLVTEHRHALSVQRTVPGANEERPGPVAPPGAYDRSGVDTDASADPPPAAPSALPPPQSEVVRAPDRVIPTGGTHRAWNRRLFDVRGALPLARGALNLGPVGWVDGALTAQWRGLGTVATTGMFLGLRGVRLQRQADGSTTLRGEGRLYARAGFLLRVVLSAGLTGHLDYLSMRALRLAEGHGALHGIGQVRLRGEVDAPVAVTYTIGEGLRFAADPHLALTGDIGYRVDASARATLAGLATWRHTWRLGDGGRRWRAALDATMRLDFTGGRLRGANLDITGTAPVAEVLGDVFTATTGPGNRSGPGQEPGSGAVAPATDAEGLVPETEGTLGTNAGWAAEARGLVDNMMLSEMRRRWQIRRVVRTTEIDGRTFTSTPPSPDALARSIRQDCVAAVLAVQRPDGSIAAQWEGLKRFESGTRHAEQEAIAGLQGWAAGRELTGHALLILVNQVPCIEDPDCDGTLTRTATSLRLQYRPPAIPSATGPYQYNVDKRRRALIAYARQLIAEQPP
jgi:hypothetical protein